MLLSPHVQHMLWVLFLSLPAQRMLELWHTLCHMVNGVTQSQITDYSGENCFLSLLPRLFMALHSQNCYLTVQLPSYISNSSLYGFQSIAFSRYDRWHIYHIAGAMALYQPIWLFWAMAEQFSWTLLTLVQNRICSTRAICTLADLLIISSDLLCH